MAKRKIRERSLKAQYVQLFGMPSMPAASSPDNLAQPDPRRSVDSFTTYGIDEIPSEVIDAKLGAGTG